MPLNSILFRKNRFCRCIQLEIQSCTVQTRTLEKTRGVAQGEWNSWLWCLRRVFKVGSCESTLCLLLPSLKIFGILLFFWIEVKRAWDRPPLPSPQSLRYTLNFITYFFSAIQISLFLKLQHIQVLLLKWQFLFWKLISNVLKYSVCKSFRLIH